MGIDRKYTSFRKGKRTTTRSEDPYLNLLVRLFQLLRRRTEARFNRVVLRRLCLSRVNRPPVSIRKLAEYAEKASPECIFVVVATLTDDVRLLVVPKMTIAALRVTESARLRIEKSGGQVLTLDQLALQRPTGSKTMIIQGSRNARKVVSHFRKSRGKHFVPHIIGKAKTGRKFERGRGRRRSKGYKL